MIRHPRWTSDCANNCSCESANARRLVADAPTIGSAFSIYFGTLDGSHPMHARRPAPQHVNPDDRAQPGYLRSPIIEPVNQRYV